MIPCRNVLHLLPYLAARPVHGAVEGVGHDWPFRCDYQWNYQRHNTTGGRRYYLSLQHVRNGNNFNYFFKTTCTHRILFDYCCCCNCIHAPVGTRKGTTLATTAVFSMFGWRITFRSPGRSTASSCCTVPCMTTWCGWNHSLSSFISNSWSSSPSGKALLSRCWSSSTSCSPSAPARFASLPPTPSRPPSWTSLFV